MIDEKKIKLMSEMALYRETEGREAFRISEYKDADEKAGAYIKTIPMGIISYMVLAVLIFFVSPGTCIHYFEILGPVFSVLVLTVILSAFLVLYALYSGFMAQRRFKLVKGGIWKYRLNAARLKNIQRAEGDLYHSKRQL